MLQLRINTGAIGTDHSPCSFIHLPWIIPRSSRWERSWGKLAVLNGGDRSRGNGPHRVITYEEHADMRSEQSDREMSSSACFFSFTVQSWAGEATWLVLLNISRGHSDILSFQTGLCCVAELCKSNKLMDRIGEIKQLPYMYSSCVLVVCFEFGFNFNL